MEDGALKIIRLKNSNGMEMVVSNYGATIISLKFPDKNKVPINVVVGLDSAKSYMAKAYQDHMLYLGTTVGRYAGRISKGYIEIDGQHFRLNHKDGVHLHGGEKGFDKKFWNVEEQNFNSVRLSYTSNHLEEGYPGTLKVKVTFELRSSNVLRILMRATTDKTTPVNLTNHSYFNLNGSESILNHELQINSNHYLEVDQQTLPKGNILSANNSKMDYRKMSQLNSRFEGLDDTFVLKNDNWAARLKSEKSGIAMEVATNQAAVVVYTPKKLPDLNYVDGVRFGPFPAICFETQNFPDAPHHSHFPSSLLLPGEVYKNESSFKFRVD